MTTTEILTGIKNWVLSKLNLKQDVISDLASIRSGAQAGATAVQPSDLSEYFNDASYDTSTHRINFYHGQDIVAYVDASPFIVDGMVDDVRIENGYLVIDFNTESGKQDISIPLTDIFDPSNYYNKTQTDTLLGNKVDKVSGKGLSTNDYTNAEKEKLSGLQNYDDTQVRQLIGQKQDIIQDLDAIRSGASAGATAVQPSVMDTALANTVAESGVYDVTANNNNAKFASLSALLSSENLDTLIPSAKRKGGMSIKFIQSSDNKYVQYRLMATAFSTNESDWQGVDVNPESGSKNLVESGGVKNALDTKEETSNKVTSISPSSTDTQYPSAKATYDNVQEAKEQMLRELYLAADTRPDTDINKLRYNDTGVDIVRTAEWGERVVHKAGHYWLNGLGDITEDEMAKIYAYGDMHIHTDYQGCKNRTFFIGNLDGNFADGKTFLYLSFTNLVSAVFDGEFRNIKRSENLPNDGFIKNTYATSLEHLCHLSMKLISGTYNLSRMKYLRSIWLSQMNCNLNISGSPYISYSSLLYIVNYATNTSAITITVHPTTYEYLTDASAMPAEHTGVVETSADIGTVTTIELVGMKEWDSTTKKYNYATKAEWQSIVTAATAKNISFASA